MKNIFKITLVLLLCLSTLGMLSCTKDSSHAHSFGQWEIIRHPTCTETGKFERFCECGEMESQTISALGHAYDTGKVIIPPTCTDPGQINYTCRLCSFVIREKLSKVAHELTEDYFISRTHHTRYCTVCLEYERSDEHFFSAEDNICLDCGYSPDTVLSLSFVLSSDGEYYTVTGLATQGIVDVVIPDAVDGIPVREIAAQAFFDCYFITTVTIPSSVTKIGEDAFFACDGLTKIKFLGSPEQWVEINFENTFSNPTYITPNIEFE